MDGIQKRNHLGCGEGGGCAAADVDSAHMLAGLGKELAADFDLFQQSGKIRVQKLRLAADGAADEAAVGTSGGAEGNAHIEGNIVFFQQVCGIDGGNGAVNGQFPALRCDVVDVFQELVGSTVCAYRLFRGQDRELNGKID